MKEYRKYQYSDAVNFFQQCADLDANHPDAINNIAYIYNSLTNYQTAADICQEASKKSPQVKTYYRNWAIALLRLERFEEAERVIKEAIKDEPENKSKQI